MDTYIELMIRMYMTFIVGFMRAMEIEVTELRDIAMRVIGSNDELHPM